MKAVPRRSTVYLEKDLHKALRMKAMETDQSVSDLINEAVRSSLLEDEHDLAMISKRRSEPNLDFESVLKDLKRRGKL